MRAIGWLFWVIVLLAAVPALAETIVPQPAPLAAFSGKKTPAGIRVTFLQPPTAFSIELAGTSIKPQAKDHLAWIIDGRAIDLFVAFVVPPTRVPLDDRQRIDAYVAWDSDAAKKEGFVPLGETAPLPCPQPRTCVLWGRKRAGEQRLSAATAVGNAVVVVSAKLDDPSGEFALRVYLQATLATVRPEAAGPSPRAAAPTDREFNGMTLGEGLRLQEMLTGVPQAALINSETASPKDASLGNVLRVSPPALVEFARFVLASGTEKVFTVTVFDGRASHAINLWDAATDADMVDYWDPWGRGSFLQVANNRAGVDAKPHPSQPRIWQIKGTDLVRVLYSITLPRQKLVDLLRLLALLDFGGDGLASALRQMQAGEKDGGFVTEKGLRAIADYLMRRKAYRPALTLARAIVELYPDSAEAKASLAATYRAAGEMPPVPAVPAGVDGASIAEVEKSEFFGFFHLARVDEPAGAPVRKGDRLLIYRPTAPKFRPLVQVTLEVGGGDHVVGRRLVLARAFIDDPSTAPFARDIAKSHAIAAAAADDRESVKEFAAELFDDVPTTVPIPGAYLAKASVPRFRSLEFRAFQGRVGRTVRVLHRGEFIVANAEGDKGPELTIWIGPAAAPKS